MNNIAQLRHRTIKAIQGEVSLWEDKLIINDRILDNMARVLLESIAFLLK